MTLPSTKKNDWLAIERDYVEGIEGEGARFPTLSDLEKKYGILSSNISRHAAVNHWSQKREVFQQKIRDARQAKVAESIANIASTMDQTNLKSLHAISVMIHNKIGKSVKSGSELANLTMKEMTSVIDDCQRIAARILGEDPTEREFIQSGPYGGREMPRAKWTVTNGRDIIDAFVLPVPNTEHVNGSGFATKPE